MLTILFRPFGFIVLKTKLFDFPIFRFWATLWRLFQKRVVRTKFDIYVSIIVDYGAINPYNYRSIILSENILNR
jgi:hypothetical protein